MRADVFVVALIAAGHQIDPAHKASHPQTLAMTISIRAPVAYPGEARHGSKEKSSTSGVGGSTDKVSAVIDIADKV